MFPATSSRRVMRSPVAIAAKSCRSVGGSQENRFVGRPAFRCARCRLELRPRPLHYRFFKSTGGVSETIACSKTRTRSASNLGVDSSPHPRQPQPWQRCGLMIVKVLRHDSHRCRVWDRRIEADLHFGHCGI